MKIRKIANSIGVIGKILNSKTTSDKDTYSCDYINDANEWKLGATISNNTVFTLTNEIKNAKEIQIITNASDVCFSKRILTSQLNDTYKYHWDGAYQVQTNYTMCAWNITTTTFKVSICEKSGTNYTGNCTSYIYYK